MSGRTWMVAGAVIVALVLGFVIGKTVLGGDGDDERVVRISTGATGAAGSPAELTLSIEDDGRPITDGEIARISTAATAAVGGGRVTDIERSDDPGEAYEVEVVKDGVEIDVALDQDLRRVPNQRFSD